VSKKKVQEAAIGYFQEYKRFGKWRVERETEAIEKRTVRTFMGSVRRLYGSERDIIKQAYNTPGQGGAADIMNTVTAEIWAKRNEYSSFASLSIQIHDDLRFVCDANALEKLIQVVVPVMEQSFNIHGEERSFTVGCEYGPSWGEMDELPRKTIEKVLRGGKM
jgi:DNA polymerase I-like protein with 3'-5' exonuclease and polymerase domains